MIQIVLTSLVLCVLVIAAFFVVARFRDCDDDGTLDAHETLANIDQMRARGDISEEEYRIITASTRRRFGDAAPSNPDRPSPRDDDASLTGQAATNHSAPDKPQSSESA